MNLREKINQDLKEAMKAKDAKKRDALRLLSSAFKQIEVDERRELSDEDTVKIIQKQVKSRNDSIEQYKKADRQDLVDKEQEEIDVYEMYLPKQLSDDELSDAIKEIITKVNAQSIKDIGKVMGVASKDLAGLADGKRINECAKNLLG
jgi:uncharacterized protein YqeY